MFITPTGTPGGTGFTSLTPVPATWFNYVANNFPRIVDGVGGGYYQLVGADLRFASSNRIVKFNQADPSFPLELRGYVTIDETDESDYVTGVGELTVNVPATFTAGITYSGLITYSSAVTFNGAVTFGSGGDITLNSGCALTAQSGSSIVVNSGSSLTVNGTTTIGGSATINGAVGFNAAVTFNDTITHTSTITRSGVNAVAVERHTQVSALSAAATLTTAADWWYVEGPTNAATVYTLKSSSPTPPEGAVLHVNGYNVGLGETIEIRREDASLAMTVTTGDGGGVFRFAGGRWRLASYSGNVTPSSVY